MSLATKAQSQKIFEKLKTKPANKVSSNIVQKTRRVLISSGVLRLWNEEPNMVFGAFRHLPMPGLLLKSP